MRLETLSATGLVEAGPLWLKSVTLAAGSDAATLVVDNSADGSGSDLLKLAAPAGQSVQWRTGGRRGVQFGVGLHGTLTGTGPVASFEFEV